MILETAFIILIAIALMVIVTNLNFHYLARKGDHTAMEKYNQNTKVLMDGIVRLFRGNQKKEDKDKKN